MKNRIKKVFGFTAVAVMSAALLAGCGGKDKDKEETVLETVAETDGDEILDLDASTGTVVSVKRNELTMETADGKELVFDIADAGKKGEKDIKEGNSVVVVYTGKVSGTDTDAAVVQLVVGMEGTGAVDAKDDETGSEDEEKGQMTGEVVEYTEGGKLVIENDKDDELYYFSTADVEIVDNKDIEEGDTISVSYVGDINGNDLVAATKITLKNAGSSTNSNTSSDKSDEDESDKEKSSSAKADTVTGEVVSASMNTVTIETTSGTTYTFSTMDAEVNAEISVGEKVEISYTGDLDEGAENVEVKTVDSAK